jgi:hypothetical protein
MQNQHVIAFKNQARIGAESKVNSFRDPSGNIASPSRAMAVFASHDLSYEIIRQYATSSFLSLPEIKIPS